MLKPISTMILLTSFSWNIMCFANSVGPHCNAFVEIDRQSASRFIDTLAMVSVMPLDGKIISSTTAISTIDVFVDSNYCSMNGLNDFDVAKWVSGQTKVDGWNISRITASMKF